MPTDTLPTKVELHQTIEEKSVLSSDDLVRAAKLEATSRIAAALISSWDPAHSPLHLPATMNEIGLQAARCLEGIQGHQPIWKLLKD